MAQKRQLGQETRGRQPIQFQTWDQDGSQLGGYQISQNPRQRSPMMVPQNVISPKNLHQNFVVNGADMYGNRYGPAPFSETTTTPTMRTANETAHTNGPPSADAIPQQISMLEQRPQVHGLNVKQQPVPQMWQPQQPQRSTQTSHSRFMSNQSAPPQQQQFQDDQISQLFNIGNSQLPLRGTLIETKLLQPDNNGHQQFTSIRQTGQAPSQTITLNTMLQQTFQMTPGNLQEADQQLRQVGQMRQQLARSKANMQHRPTRNQNKARSSSAYAHKHTMRPVAAHFQSNNNTQLQQHVFNRNKARASVADGRAHLTTFCSDSDVLGLFDLNPTTSRGHSVNKIDLSVLDRRKSAAPLLQKHQNQQSRAQSVNQRRRALKQAWAPSNFTTLSGGQDKRKSESPPPMQSNITMGQQQDAIYQSNDESMAPIVTTSNKNRKLYAARQFKQWRDESPNNPLNLQSRNFLQGSASVVEHPQGLTQVRARNSVHHKSTRRKISLNLAQDFEETGFVSLNNLQQPTHARGNKSHNQINSQPVSICTLQPQSQAQSESKQSQQQQQVEGQERLRTSETTMAKPQSVEFSQNQNSPRRSQSQWMKKGDVKQQEQQKQSTSQASSQGYQQPQRGAEDLTDVIHRVLATINPEMITTFQQSSPGNSDQQRARAEIVNNLVANINQTSGYGAKTAYSKVTPTSETDLNTMCAEKVVPAISKPFLRHINSQSSCGTTKQSQKAPDQTFGREEVRKIKVERAQTWDDEVTPPTELVPDFSRVDELKTLMPILQLPTPVTQQDCSPRQRSLRSIQVSLVDEENKSQEPQSLAVKVEHDPSSHEQPTLPESPKIGVPEINNQQFKQEESPEERKSVESTKLVEESGATQVPQKLTSTKKLLAQSVGNQADECAAQDETQDLYKTQDKSIIVHESGQLMCPKFMSEEFKDIPQQVVIQTDRSSESKISQKRPKSGRSQRSARRDEPTKTDGPDDQEVKDESKESFKQDCRPDFDSSSSNRQSKELSHS